VGSSFISNHIHVVFSTKNRIRSIGERLQPKLWAYMAGIAENHVMHAVKIGGISRTTCIYQSTWVGVGNHQGGAVDQGKLIPMGQRTSRPQIRMARRT